MNKTEECIDVVPGGSTSGTFLLMFVACAIDTEGADQDSDVSYLSHERNRRDYE